MNQAMQKLPPVTADTTAKMYGGMLGQQLGVVGDVLGGLIEQGNSFMESNPGMANFIRAAGGMPMQFETPDFLKGLAAKHAPAPQEQPAPQQPEAPMPAWMQHMSPQQAQAYQQWQMANGGQNFNVNDYMRTQNLGGR